MKWALMGDTHFPFTHLPTIEMFYEWISENQPTHVFQMGDLHDQFSQSRFPRKHIINPYEEIKQSIKMASEFWKDVRRYVPNAHCIQICGNHDSRAEKRIIEKCPELHPLLEDGLRKLYTFTGVETHMDPRQELIVEGINITHGHRKHGDHMMECMMPTICGHTHVGGVVFKKIRHQLLWELNCGYAADPTHEALKYTAKSYVHWTHGFGVVDKFGPRFIPWDGNNR